MAGLGVSSGATAAAPRPPPGGGGGGGGGGGTGGSSPGVAWVIGAPSAGDRLFPAIGNGGYDALHYDLDLSYEPSSHRLAGTTTMTARATANLAQFSLDLQ